MTAIIEVERLTKRYGASSKPAVDGVSFAVDQGEVFGLLGPNGAGKTTLISMLSGLLAPSEGTAWLGGHDLRTELSAVKRIIGLVPQDLALYPTLSTRENLVYFGGLYGLTGRSLRDAVARALVMVRLEERADDRVETLSGGMKRRTNIAAGLLHGPKILFLDEPTVGVDPQSRNFIFDGIEALKRAGLTVIYTTHYMEEAERLCDRLAIVDRGAIIALGTPRALIEAHGGSILVELDGAAEAVRPAVTAISGVRSVTCEGARLTIATEAPARALGAIVAAVTANGRAIRSVEILNENLESVFLDLTGRRLRE